MAIFIFLLFALPSLLELVDMGGGILRGLQRAAVSLSEPETLMYAIAAVAVPGALCVVLPQRWLVRLALVSASAFLILPTVNVYSCAPVHLDNAHVGTNFSLQTTAKGVLTSSLASCLKGRLFSSFALSVYTPRVVIVAQRSGAQEVNLTSTDDASLPFRCVLLRSPRSVRGHVYHLHLIAKVPKRLASRGVLDDLMARNISDPDLYRFVGRLTDIPKHMHELKSNLERQNLFVRPLLLETQDLQLVG